MSNPYSLRQSVEGYYFVTEKGDEYFAYFTPFSLMDADGQLVETFSFGFECKRSASSNRLQYDERAKLTLVQIIKAYFETNGENALLYICINNDGRARQRNITFNSWFSELGEGFEKYRSDGRTKKLCFYSTIFVKASNTEKQKFIDAFYYTIDYWFPED